MPSAYLGFGGLGRYWHGVIPTGLHPNPDSVAAEDFEALFKIFYPATPVKLKIGRPWLFVPRRPIRTPQAWSKLVKARQGRLTIVHGLADSFAEVDGAVTIRTREARYVAPRLWVAAGTLHTPKLLAASLKGFDGLRATVSDHVISYIGQIDRDRNSTIDAPHVEHSPDGFWTPATYGTEGRTLFTLKPARFSYRRLDHGIEQRAAFGLPTSGVISKIIRASSLGLVAEAAYNKFGLFPNARRLSVYAQILVPDAYAFDPAMPRITPRSEAIHKAIADARAHCYWAPEVKLSAKPELFINGIHLHHSVEPQLLQQRGINLPNALIQVVDASVASDIGAEHHSFKLMAAAFAKAKRS